MEWKKVTNAIRITGNVTGAALNVGLFIISIALIYFCVVEAFNSGMAIANAELAERPSKPVSVTIPEGSAIEDVAAVLKENGLISNELVFILQSTLNGTNSLFMPGTYDLNENMKAGEIMDALQSSERRRAEEDYLTVTIPEGLSLAQIAGLLENRKVFATAQEFMDECAGGSYDEYDFLPDVPEGGDRANRMQGYLFPDTYFLTLRPTPRELINKMLSRFAEVYGDDMRERTEALAGELDWVSMDTIVTVASIIEKETSAANERALVADAVYNRLAAGDKLEMVSTVLYAVDKRRDRLVPEDLTVRDAYNTFRYTGLPPGPIGSPGRAALEAALNPAGGDSFYFVLDDEEDGTHLFTADASQYAEWKELYGQFY
ncbi:MAG: endolytic transglycosylase MltG [Clostridiales bacterium]|nr:endolytic transglycosylase MltG [Clostridiales bacterium]